MASIEGRKVLAIGMDAAEPRLVRRMIADGMLPTLGRLLDEGEWATVQSPAHIGSGAVWPTFTTGLDPQEHGIHSDWSWQPEMMRLARVNCDHLTPFWKALALAGLRVGVMDVPFAPHVSLDEGFEISEWGAHDPLEGRMRVSPVSLSELIAKGVGPHPFSTDGSDTNGPRDHRGLKRLSDACVEGARRRGQLASQLLKKFPVDLSIIVFTEIHHAAHRLWHTVDGAPSLSSASGRAAHALESPSLLDVYREVDGQIGRLVEAAGNDATVIVFSLHGMRAARGIAALLEPLLFETGLAVRSDWRMQAWTERAHSVLAAVKRRTPPAVKNFYYKAISREIVARLAQPTMLPLYDWRKTRAFALPTDQHGWIRLNLAGREALGLVTENEYEETCDRIEEMLRELKGEDGQSLVKDVIRPASIDACGARACPLPDLVVHWTDAALSSKLKIKDRALETSAVALKQTGQHSLEGFCIIKGDASYRVEAGTIAASDFHSIITAALGASQYRLHKPSGSVKG